MAHLNCILVCDEPEAVERLRKAIDEHYDMALSHTVEEAVLRVRNEPICLIICGERFDGSRMLELLSIIKLDEKTRGLPFMCFRHLHSSFSAEVQQGVKMSAELLGACHYVDDAYHLKDEDIRRIIEECIAMGQSSIQ